MADASVLPISKVINRPKAFLSRSRMSAAFAIILARPAKGNAPNVANVFTASCSFCSICGLVNGSNVLMVFPVEGSMVAMAMVEDRSFY